MMNGQQMPSKNQGAGEMSKTLPTDIIVGMQQIGQAMTEMGVPQQTLEKLAQAIVLYQEAIQEGLGGGSQGQGKGQMAPSDQQGVPMNAAGY